VVSLPPGTFYIGSAVTMKSKVTVRGAGMGATILRQAETGVRLFTRTYSAGNNLSYVAFEDFTCRGLHDTTATLGSDQDRHFAVDGVDRIVFRNVESLYCRQMAITAGYCNEVLATGCRVQYCARDAFNFSTSKRCTVTGNHIRNVSDDAIAIHTNSAQGNPPAEGHVISNNQIEDSYGIKLLGAVKASITGNVGSRLKAYGIWFADESSEGNNDLLAVTISGNTFTDIINGNEFGGGDVHCGIRISSSVTSFQAPVVGAGSPDINYPENFSYLSNAANQNAGGQGINIVGNTIIGFTLPAVAAYTTWGYGQAYTNTGFADPDLSSGFERNCIGVRLGGALLTVNIVGNQLEGLASGVYVETSMTYLGQLSVRSNTIRRYANHGVTMNSGAQMYGVAVIGHNTFDGDPYLENSARTAGPDGTWSTGSVTPTAINAANYKGITLIGNEFLNLNVVGNADGTSSLSWSSNVYYMEPASTMDLWNTSVATNKGIRNPSGLGYDGRLVWVNSTPTSGTYGQEVFRPYQVQDAMPSAGSWVKGMFVRNVSSFGAGTQALGWHRITTGSGNVLSTDWRRVDITST
jgi:hypothetical protein